MRSGNLKVKAMVRQPDRGKWMQCKLPAVHRCIASQRCRCMQYAQVVGSCTYAEVVGSA